MNVPNGCRKAKRYESEIVFSKLKIRLHWYGTSGSVYICTVSQWSDYKVMNRLSEAAMLLLPDRIFKLKCQRKTLVRCGTETKATCQTTATWFKMHCKRYVTKSRLDCIRTESWTKSRLILSSVEQRLSTVVARILAFTWWDGMVKHVQKMRVLVKLALARTHKTKTRRLHTFFSCHNTTSSKVITESLGSFYC